MRRVVVTGLGAITPVGKDINDFWDSLTAGRHGIAPITRFDTADFKATLAAEVKDFSPADYYTDKSEMRRTDLFAQYAMGAAVQAITDSGIEGKIAPERLGVYVGSGIGGITTFVNETLKLQERGPSRVSPFFIPMMISNMAAGTIAIRFAAKGPTLPVVTACATSSNTVGEAFRAIAYGYADAILAGGSEGAGMLVLEEYEHAAARDAKIYAEVVGYGNTCDAYHITAPHPEAEGAARAFALAVEQAGISSADKVYINAHGTSTPMNDKVETLAVKKALGDAAYRAQISSTKSMTGHMLGAAGAVEAIASVLALHTGVLPPTVGYRDADPECDLDYIPNQARKSAVDFSISSSLGFGGHNAVLAFKKLD